MKQLIIKLIKWVRKKGLFMEDLIHYKNNEFTKVLESYRNCKVELVSEKRKMYNIVSLSGVTWKDRSLKWGVIAEGKERLRIDLDYPIHLFTEEGLSDYTGLPLKRNIPKLNGTSHINPTVGGKDFDTLRIILYADKLETYDFGHERIKELFMRIVANNIS
jgi:hypothetical protein